MVDSAGDDDLALLAYGRWCARRKKVLNGKPGKAALAEFHQVLLAMPHKRLIESSLCDGTGTCAVGQWIYRRWVDGGMAPKEAWKTLQTVGVSEDLWDEGSYAEWKRTIEVGATELGITRTLAEVVSYVSDEEGRWDETPEQRYQRVLKWVEKQLSPQQPAGKE
jgi:hypothetical protein